MHFLTKRAPTLGRKPASKNLIWKLHLKSVRLVNLMLHDFSLLCFVLYSINNCFFVVWVIIREARTVLFICIVQVDQILLKLVHLQGI